MYKIFVFTLYFMSVSLALNSQFYVKAGLLVNQQDKNIKDLNFYKDKSSYTLGIGQELKLFKIRLGAGVQLMNFLTEDGAANLQNNNMTIGFPIQAIVMPISRIGVGAGIMPIVKLNDENPILEKKLEGGGFLALQIKILKWLSVEGTYNIGLSQNEISFRDIKGILIKEIKNRFQFYTLGAKVRF